MCKCTKISSRNLRYVNRTIKKLHNDNLQLVDVVKNLKQQLDTYKMFLDVILNNDFENEQNTEVVSEVVSEPEIVRGRLWH